MCLQFYWYLKAISNIMIIIDQFSKVVQLVTLQNSPAGYRSHFRPSCFYLGYPQFTSWVQKQFCSSGQFILCFPPTDKWSEQLNQEPHFGVQPPPTRLGVHTRPWLGLSMLSSSATRLSLLEARLSNQPPLFPSQEAELYSLCASSSPEETHSDCSALNHQPKQAMCRSASLANYQEQIFLLSAQFKSSLSLIYLRLPVRSRSFHVFFIYADLDGLLQAEGNSFIARLLHHCKVCKSALVKPLFFCWKSLD